MSNQGVAIVTGSASGIGKAIALRLASDGFDIALNDLPSSNDQLLKVAERVQALGRRTVVITGDVSKEADVDALVNGAVKELGDLWVMVANAGIVPSPTPVADTSLEVWNNVLSINLTGVFLCYRAASRQLQAQGKGGRIIGASSGYGKKGGPNMSAYCATKFAIRGLTQSLAAELGKVGITVNAYAPGWIQTAMMDKHLDDIVTVTAPGSDAEVRKEAIRKSMIEANNLKRVGVPDDIAGLVSYLASDQASFMTGQTVSINGGGLYD